VKIALNTSESFFATIEGGVDWSTRPDRNHQPILADGAARQFQARGKFTGTVGISTFVSTVQLSNQPAGV